MTHEQANMLVVAMTLSDFMNDALILGPGGFRFGDYWRLDLPMALLVIAVAVPMLLWAWPLQAEAG